MSLFPQHLLDIHDELIVDLFAGGGGASSGIEQATGRMVDIAINHDPVAVSLHEANHPCTQHFVSDVFEVDPRAATNGRPVGLLWASPDCTYHSKARGGKPIRDANRKRRALAWVVTRWAGTVRPRVIILENVEEFADWGPLVGAKESLRPCPKRRGQTFRQWVRSLQQHGYHVECRELRACDYGAPTIRKRLFVIARCDGQPITWPEPTCGPGRRPYRAIAECIDWHRPMCSIFATQEEAAEWARTHGVARPIRPLKENTLRRIARGIQKFVLSGDPFIVGVGGRQGQSPERSVSMPFQTTTAKADSALVVPYLVPRYGERDGQQPRSRSISEPSPVIVPAGNGGSLVAAHLSTYYGDKPGAEVRGQHMDRPVATQTSENRHAVVAAFLAQNNGGFYDGTGREVSEPLATVLANSRGHHGLIAAHIQRDFGASTGSRCDNPIGTLTSEGGGHATLVASFLAQYNGTAVGQEVSDPLKTIPTVDRFGLVSVEIDGQTYVITDIAMRMLTPNELFLAQGFRSGYITDRTADGTPLTKTEQVRLCGNSVCPPIAEALVRANCASLIARSRKTA